MEGSSDLIFHLEPSDEIFARWYPSLDKTFLIIDSIFLSLAGR